MHKRKKAKISDESQSLSAKAEIDFMKEKAFTFEKQIQAGFWYEREFQSLERKSGEWDEN
jgi:hypothetical protein